MPGTARVSRPSYVERAAPARSVQDWCAWRRHGVRRAAARGRRGRRRAGRRPAAPPPPAERAGDARGAADAAVARSRSPPTVPSHSGRSNGSTGRTPCRSPRVSPRPRQTGAPTSAALVERRGLVVGEAGVRRPAAAALVDEPGDHLRDHEQHRHRDGQHQHRERVGRRRRDGGEHEGADDDPRPVVAQGLAGARPRRGSAAPRTAGSRRPPRRPAASGSRRRSTRRSRPGSGHARRGEPDQHLEALGQHVVADRHAGEEQRAGDRGEQPGPAPLVAGAGPGTMKRPDLVEPVGAGRPRARRGRTA